MVIYLDRNICLFAVPAGSYAMVVGELVDRTAPVSIRASKVQDLTTDLVAQEMWGLEVKDLHQLIKQVT